MFAFQPTRGAATSLRVLARLLRYPDAQLREQLPALRAALHDARALSAARLAELDRLIDAIGRADALVVESDYVELFDRGHSTSLHLFEHVHGDSRDRGPAMIDLAQTYQQAGLWLAEGELPDHLPVVLEYASTQPARAAREFLGELAHILNALNAALQQRDSVYAAVPTALLELAGEAVQPVPVAADAPIDVDWAEPPVFDGCSSKGQARPEQPQPINIVRSRGHIEGARP